MTLNIQPTPATLGAIVTGVKLTELDPTTWQLIYQAFLEYGVLIFPEQHLNDQAQAEFAQRFGEPEKLSPKQRGANIKIANTKPDGSVAGPDEYQYQILKGNEGWHTDSTYMPVSARASILSAQVVPAEGGETEWADMRAAFAALDENTKRRISDLAAYHSLFYSQAKVGHKPQKGASYGLDDQNIPLRPLVKVHPVTGRPALFTGRHAYGIPGLSEEESESLLEELMAFACQPPRVFAHKWQSGDVVMWDNRCVLHRARPYDYSQPRIMRHVRVAGDPNSEAGINA